MRKIRGNTVGTTMNPEKIAEMIGGGGGMTDEEFAAKVEEVITADVAEWGPIAYAVEDVAEYSADWVSEMKMEQHDLLRPDEDNGGYIRNVPTIDEFDTAIGDIESALDGIIAMQTELIGGDGV